MAKVKHILHLSDQSLRWMTVEQSRGGLEFKEKGSLEGDPIECLDQWAENEGRLPGEILLYDARPRYYCFATTMPAGGAKQSDSILNLKIRQELGLGEDAIYSASQRLPGGEKSDQVKFFTLVARRRGIDEILEWKERHDLNRLWVGADVVAIRTLLNQGLVPSSTLIVNAEPGGATLYRLDENQQVIKERVAAGSHENGSRWANGDRSTFAARADFGDHGTPAVLGAQSGLIDLPAASIDFGQGDAMSALGRLGGEAERFDAVVLGGLVQLAGSAPSMASLGPKSKISWLDPAFARRLDLRWVVAAALFAAIVMAVSLWSVQGLREGARVRLSERARALAVPSALYRAQEATLKRIAAERSPTLPILRALHEAAPSGITLNSLKVGETGIVQIAGTARSQAAPTTFFGAITQLDMLERVQLQDVKSSGPQGRTFSFQGTAQLKARGRRR